MIARVDVRKPFLAVLVALITFAWLTLWLWGHSPYGRLLSHHHIGDATRDDRALLLLFVAGWTIMTVAMMLPTSLPLVALFHALTHRRSDRILLVALVIAGYIGIWTLFGVLVHLVDRHLHEAVAGSAWLTAHAWAIGAATLIVAGLYQFTPLKHRCLERCRSPLSFVMEHWTGLRPRFQAVWLGAHHGLFCLGCCWTLMLLMFTAGLGNLGWMLVLGAVMAAEKNLTWGQRLSLPVGVALVTWGALLVASHLIGFDPAILLGV
jgi:predicted metal-binding membrane protein